MKSTNTLPPLLNDLSNINLISFISMLDTYTENLSLVLSQYPHSTFFVQYAYKKNNSSKLSTLSNVSRFVE